MMTLLKLRPICRSSVKFYSLAKVEYVQGQSPAPGIREYFYFIDHQGMGGAILKQVLKVAYKATGFLVEDTNVLFLDDARMKNFTSCFKDKKFLEFFFKRLKLNTTGQYYPEFPYLSPCGRERNFVRCDDYPIVFTHVFKDKHGEDRLSYGHAGELLSVKFTPEKVYMAPETGRVYHPGPEKVGGIGLVRSKLAIELSKWFQFEHGEQEGPTHLSWNERTHTLDREWYHKAVKGE